MSANSPTVEELLARVSNLEARLDKVLGENMELRKENRLLKAKYKKLEKEHEELKVKYKDLELRYGALEEKALSLQQQLYGKKRDKVSKQANDNLDNAEDKAVKEYLKELRKKERKRGGKVGRKALDKSQAIDEVRSYDFVEGRKCCEQEMAKMGDNESHHTEYAVQFKRIKIRQAKYVCKKCHKIIEAKGSKLALPKVEALPGLLARVMLDKFGNGLPFYRQSQNFGYGDKKYSRQVLNNWSANLAEVLSVIVELMFKRMLQSSYLMCDESKIVLLDKEGKGSGTGYMCAIAEIGKEFSNVYFWAISGRSQELIKEKLKGFQGYLQTDALNFYEGLKEVAGIILVNCWAHGRRKFTDVLKIAGIKAGIAYEVVEMIEKLYDVEREAKEESYERKKEVRQEKSKKILDKLKSYLEEQEKLVPPKSKIGEGIRYLLSRWLKFIVYLEDGRVEIDDNFIERCIKYFVIGRKNWLFAQDMEGARIYAFWYSLIVTCKVNDLNPYEYLGYVISQIPYINKHEEKEVEKLLPEYYNVNKRFDEEYRVSRGIKEEIIIGSKEEGGGIKTAA